MLRYVVTTADPQVYAVGFRSHSDSSADITLTFFAGDEAYAARLPGVAFAQADDPQLGYIYSWRSGAVYVRVPTATMLDVARLDVDDPTTQQPFDCAGGFGLIRALRGLGKATIDPASSIERADIELARAGYASATQTVATVLPSEPKLDCAEPYKAAEVQRPFNLEFPPAEARLGHIGSVWTTVEIDASGRVVGTQLYRRSGWLALDEAARDAAARSTYSAAIFRCKPVAGIHIFGADFGP